MKLKGKSMKLKLYASASVERLQGPGSAILQSQQLAAQRMHPPNVSCQGVSMPLPTLVPQLWLTATTPS